MINLAFNPRLVSTTDSSRASVSGSRACLGSLVPGIYEPELGNSPGPLTLRGPVKLLFTFNLKCVPMSWGGRSHTHHSRVKFEFAAISFSGEMNPRGRR